MSDIVDQFEEQNTPKKSFLVPVLILLIVLLVAALVASQMGGFSSKEPLVEVEAPVVLTLPEPSYYKMGPVVANTGLGSSYQYVQLAVVFSVSEQTLLDSIPKYEARLKNLVQSALRDASDEDLLTNKGVKEITKKLTVQLNNFLSEQGVDLDYIEDIFLSDIIVE